MTSAFRLKFSVMFLNDLTFSNIWRIVNNRAGAYKTLRFAWLYAQAAEAKSGKRRLSSQRCTQQCFVDVFDSLIVTKARKKENGQGIFKNAKKSHYLTFTHIWQSSSGNVNFSPWITR